MTKKNAPNEMRDLLGKMRGKLVEFNKPDKKNMVIKEMTVRDMLKITRNLNEGEEEREYVNKVTPRDVSFVEQSIKNVFENSGMNVMFDFPADNDPHELYADDVFVYWGATVNGVLMFTYTINTHDDADTGVKFKYVEESRVLEDSDEYMEIVEILQQFFDSTFFPYFREIMKK